MSVTLSGGPKIWVGGVDSEGHRTYKVTHRVISDTGRDGPNNVRLCLGLPEPGDTWRFQDDSDIDAYCKFDADIRPAPEIKPGDIVTQWDVEQTFTTKPEGGNRSRCQDEVITDPLLEPAKISGSFIKYNEEAFLDRFSRPILNSAYEMYRGAQVEFDKNRMTIKIEQNVASPLFAYVLPAMMIDCVNVAPLWGMAPRCIKLSAAPWERKFYGRCSVYYTRTLEFEINPDTFDRNLLDEGTKALNGRWNAATGDWQLVAIAGADPSPFDPRHFCRYKDRNGENTRVILNGYGVPAGVRVVGSRPTVRRASNPYNPVGGFGYWYTKPGGRIRDTSRTTRMVIGSGNVDSTINNPITIYTTSPHGLTSGLTITITDVRGATGINGTWSITRIDATSFSLNGTRNADIQDLETQQGQITGNYYQSGDIESNTCASPIVITSSGHGLQSGQGVTVEDCWDNQDANGDWVVTVIDANRFSLNGSTCRQLGDVAGSGSAKIDEPTAPGYIHVEKYNEADFLLLGIPTSF